MSRIEKTIARQKEKIDEGQYYEAHQQLRVIANRYVKAATYPPAIEILSNGAHLLFKANQGSSGGDLCLFLMEVYNKAEVKVTSESKSRVLGLLRAFPAGEFTRKRFVGELLGWSSRQGDYPAGDPEIHHVAGSICGAEDDILDAERHLFLGTKDSPALLTQLEYNWYTEDTDPSSAPLYAARCILPYLLLGNLRAANLSHLLFTTKLSQSSNASSLGVTEVSSSQTEMRVHPSLPLLNFLGLLLLAIQKGAPDLFRQLRSHYAGQLRDKAQGSWDECLAQIGEMYFGIKVPSQSNPLFDMMGSLLMGGGGGGGAGQKKQARLGGGGPAAPGLD